MRRRDGPAERLTIDLAVHSDEGDAGALAKRAEPGDSLQFRQPGGGDRPSPDASWYLLAGDESALPAIARSLEALPAKARGRALVVVDDEERRAARDTTR